MFTQLKLPCVYAWGTAVELDRYDCFLHIAGLSEPEKESFKALMLDISVHGGNSSSRLFCAEIFHNPMFVLVSYKNQKFKFK